MRLLSRIDKIQAMHQTICKYYDEIMVKFSNQIIFLNNKTFYRYPVIINTEKIRSQIIHDLHKVGIGALPLYPTPLNDQPRLKEILDDHHVYPNADYISKHLMTLPVNEFVNNLEIKKINDILCRSFMD